jgi:hypothetical protein
MPSIGGAENAASSSYSLEDEFYFPLSDFAERGDGMPPDDPGLDDLRDVASLVHDQESGENLQLDEDTRRELEALGYLG